MLEGCSPSRSPIPAAVSDALDDAGYLPDRGLATAAFLAMRMHRPLFLEGDPGVGKTALAQALATITGSELVRLQCYEGIDASQALYDWDFPRQILHLRAAGDRAATAPTLEASLYDRRFLVARPILQALEHSPVGAADRRDRPRRRRVRGVPARGAGRQRGDHPRARHDHAPRLPPLVVLTSNRTREVHDALKRRCLYHWVAHPDFAREVAIVRRRMPEATEQLAREVAAAVGRLREADLLKPPGVAETIDWAQALHVLGAARLDAETARGDPRRGGEVPRGHGAGAARAGRPARRLSDDGRLEHTITDPIVTMTGFARALRGSRGGGRHRPRLAARSSRAGRTSTPSDAEQVYWAGRLTLCGEPDDLPRYDAAFDAWFRGRTPPCRGRRHPAADRPSVAPVDGRPRRARRAPTGDEPTRSRPAASDAEVLRHRDVAAAEPTAERDEINRLIAPARAPRCRPAPHGAGAAPAVTAASTSRAPCATMLRDGGEPGRLARQRPRDKPRRLVLLLDVSGSMTPYADVLLRFAHAAVRVAPTSTEVFTVGTRLTRVTRQLRLRDPERGAAPPPARRCRTGAAAPGWASRCRPSSICWGQRGTARGAVVVVASDGWERGDAGPARRADGPAGPAGAPGGLGQPAPGKDGFAPVTGGMVAGAAARRRAASPGTPSTRCIDAGGGDRAVRDVLTELLEPGGAAGETVGLGTVVGTWRSAPRQPGASMLVGPDGTAVGSVSGGCVEGAVYELAERVASTTGRRCCSATASATTTRSSVGLTCGGIIDIFVERGRPRDASPSSVEVVADIQRRPAGRGGHRDQSASADGRLGRRLVVRPDGGRAASLGSRPARRRGARRRPRACCRRAAPASSATARRRAPRSTTSRCSSPSYAPRPRMIVFGAIDFAAAVARVGSFLGYRVTVCDARPTFATTKRFPDADEVVVAWPHRYLAADRGRRAHRGLRAHPRPQVRRAAARGRAAAAAGLPRRDGFAAHQRRPRRTGCASSASPTPSWPGCTRRSGSTSAPAPRRRRPCRSRPRSSPRAGAAPGRSCGRFPAHPPLIGPTRTSMRRSIGTVHDRIS